LTIWSYDDRVSSARDELLVDIRRWQEAVRALRSQLVANEREAEAGLELLDQGASISDAVQRLAGSRGLQLMEDALTEFKRCRYLLRRSLTNAALEEGVTTEELIAAFGISRQIAASFAEEDRQWDGSEL